VFTVISVSVPAKITGISSACCVQRPAACTALRNIAAAGSNPVLVHIEAAIDNADEDDELPLAPWH
jgi:hydrogenase maturation factor